ncbi:MAG: DUF4384 domain-containing protein [Blastocatellia bacterium]
MKNFYQRISAFAGCAITICFIGFTAPAFTQDRDDDASRRFWPPNFRPAASQPGSAPKTGRYKRTTPALAKGAMAAESMNDAVVGITVWRLRPSKEADEARILVKKSGKNWTPERVEANTGFGRGQMLRLSIEVPRTGYLYVIDREQYADGSLSDPYLIFPANPASDENKVAAGRIVEIPNQSDDQAYFELKSLGEAGRPAQVAELLTLIVTPSPIKELPKRAPGDDSPLLLSKSLIEKWEKEWAVASEQLELENGAGTTYTRAEQAAGGNAAKRLTQEDPLPQTVFRLAVKPGKPMLVKLPLKITR